jgi:AAA domain
MSLLQKLGTGQGHLKAGFLGFQKSGKTYTAALLGIGTRKVFGLTGPLAMYDTEGGSEYIAPLVKRETGIDMVGMRSRSFDDLVSMAHECVEAGVSVLVVDSVTHVWRELCDAYMKQVNEGIERQNERFSKKRPLRSRLEFQDWAHVKGVWARWADFYVNSPLHIIICGRAGYEYDMQDNDRGGKELVKTGIKMKTEGEFGFEPSLLVEMEREQESNGEGGFTLRRRATVLGDRFGVIDGATTIDPTFEFFAPHVAMLKPGAHATIDTRVKTDTGVDEEGDGEWGRERKSRTILCEEIQGELVAVYPGQKAEEKKAKADLIFAAFKTRSWTAVESMDSDRLRRGLAFIRRELRGPEPDPLAAEITDQDSDLNFTSGPESGSDTARKLVKSQAAAVLDFCRSTKPTGDGAPTEDQADAVAQLASVVFDDFDQRGPVLEWFRGGPGEAQTKKLVAKLETAAKARREFEQPSLPV